MRARAHAGPGRRRGFSVPRVVEEIVVWLMGVTIALTYIAVAGLLMNALGRPENNWMVVIIGALAVSTIVVVVARRPPPPPGTPA